MSSLTAIEFSSRRQRATASSEGTASTSISSFDPSQPAENRLLRLPPEIREEIYAFLFSAGDLSMLRTCKDINDEAQSVFYRTASFRKDIGYRGAYGFHDTPLSPLAQNLELRCDLYNGFMTFAPGNICRRRMLMKLDLGLKHFLSMHQYKIAMLLAEPERFIGFRTLEVTFKFNELDCPGADPWTAADKPMMRQSVKERLEPTLGPATEYERDGGQCVGFRPWTFANHRYQQMKTL